MPKDNRGNPNIKNYGFTTDRDEPLTEKLNIRLTKSMMAKLKSLENVPEFVRQCIQDGLDKLDQSDSGEA
ncbi:hypothetical protein I8752_09405 [Nostocaceae cyanobacterium CENA369]|uniref:Uncharacterized protein n=1 Tax=Dendronalium phyllosphericum CENA369 TaxID=1725256 RepID=A0A8J7I491_9NOST|nr:hypothetical protein [Dendronalium phyllosphericum]MBH8573230.1 hypothetical protein [Dendronalium phyllosphericum CENA369]